MTKNICLKLADIFNLGNVLTDSFKNKWTMGKLVGQGGFGLIYLGNLVGFILKM